MINVIIQRIILIIFCAFLFIIFKRSGDKCDLKNDDELQSFAIIECICEILWYIVGSCFIASFKDFYFNSVIINISLKIFVFVVSVVFLSQIHLMRAYGNLNVLFKSKDLLETFPVKSYIVLSLIRIFTFFSFINLGLYIIYPVAFNYNNQLPIYHISFDFFYYTMGNCFLYNIYGIEPVSIIAKSIQIITTFMFMGELGSKVATILKRTSKSKENDN